MHSSSVMSTPGLWSASLFSKAPRILFSSLLSFFHFHSFWHLPYYLLFSGSFRLSYLTLSFCFHISIWFLFSSPSLSLLIANSPSVSLPPVFLLSLLPFPCPHARTHAHARMPTHTHTLMLSFAHKHHKHRGIFLLRGCIFTVYVLDNWINLFVKMCWENLVEECIFHV